MIVTVVVAAGLVHPLTVAVTEYVPVPKVEIPAMVGLSEADVKLFGPFHEYVAPPTVVAVRDNVCPEQIGSLLPAGEGEDGIVFIVTEIVAVLLTHPLAMEVTFTEYVPAASVETLDIVGFCKVEVKPFGPLHE